MPDKVLFAHELKINVLYNTIPQFGNIQIDRCRNVSNFFPFIYLTIIRNYTEGVVSFLLAFFLLKLNVILVVGTILPSKNPQGLRGSILSKITFTIAVNGMERNMPGTPHNAAPTKTTMIDIKAFIFTLEATM